MIYGLYARQSVEKADSLSIEMQLDYCRKCVPENAEIRTYADKGFTGTNTNRPAFQQLQADLWKGKLDAVVVYRLDRISRSLSDFARLSQQLHQANIQLISAVEQIDTRLPMGHLLQNLLVMFAELEQQTIAARIRDNYMARAEKLLPLGGSVPYGYVTGKNGIYQPHEETGAVVWQIFQQAFLGKSCDRIAADLNMQHCPSPKGTLWHGSTISRMIQNPCYVQGNDAVLAYFVRQGLTLLHPEDMYRTGFGYRKIGTCLAAGSHAGIIPADLWLKIQQMRQRRLGHTNSGSGQQSWLQGKVYCRKCGMPCYVRGNGAGQAYRYLVCRGKRLGICSGSPALRIQAVEAAAEPTLWKAWQRLRVLPAVENQVHSEENFTEILPKILLQERQQTAMLRKQAELSTKAENLWKALSLSQKRQLADILIERIYVETGRVQIYLKA